MQDILLSKDTIHSIEFVEEAKPVRNTPWVKDGLVWKMNVYDIVLTVSNDLVTGPTDMTATLRILANAYGPEIFSNMGIDVSCPVVDGPVGSRF